MEGLEFREGWDWRAGLSFNLRESAGRRVVVPSQFREGPGD